MILTAIIGLALRFALAPFLTMHYDMSFWSGTVNDITPGDGLYGGRFYWYTPVWGYILSILSGIMDIFSIDTQGVIIHGLYFGPYAIGDAIITSPAFNFIVKLPLIISDLFVSLVIYLIIKKVTADEKKAVIGFAIWFLCPLVIWVSGIQAQFDTLAVLGMMLSVLFLLNKRYLLAGIFLSFGMCTKLFPGMLLPLMLAYIIAGAPDRSQKIKGIASILIGFSVFTILIFLTPILNGELWSSLGFFSSRMDEPITSVNGLLEWDNILYIAPMIAFFTFYLSFLLAKTKSSLDHRFILFSGLVFASLFIWPFFPTLPQYILVLLPFMILLLSMGYEMKLPILALSIIITVSVIMWTGVGVLYPLAVYTGILDLNYLEAISGTIDSYTGPIYVALQFVKFIPAVLMVYFIYIKQRDEKGGEFPYAEPE
ncbi:MAG: hypothetical protein LBR42_03320 [Candidatus Methanoplasma sp.]|nr:hypothetical protein [Candidatus Methanoplasma sp.]